MQRSRLATRAVLPAVLLLAAGCQDGEPLANDAATTAKVADVMEDSSFARLVTAFGGAMGEAAFRDTIYARMQKSRRTESHKLHLTELLTSEANGYIATRIAAHLPVADRTTAQLLQAVRRIRPLELDMPIPVHRTEWKAGARAAVFGQLAYTTPAIAFSTDGSPFAASEHLIPSGPVLVIGPWESSKSEEVPYTYVNSGPANTLGTWVAPRLRAALSTTELGGSTPGTSVICPLSSQECGDWGLPPNPPPQLPPPPQPPGVGWASAPPGIYIEEIHLRSDGTRLPSTDGSPEIEVQVVASTGSQSRPEVVFRCAAAWKSGQRRIQWTDITRSYFHGGQWISTPTGFVFPGVLMTAADINAYAATYNTETNPYTIQIWEDDHGRDNGECSNYATLQFESDLQRAYNIGKASVNAYKLITKIGSCAAGGACFALVLAGLDLRAFLTKARTNVRPDELLGSPVFQGRQEMPDGTFRLFYSVIRYGAHRHPPSWNFETDPYNGFLTLRFVGVDAVPRQ